MKKHAILIVALVISLSSSALSSLGTETTVFMDDLRYDTKAQLNAVWSEVATGAGYGVFDGNFIWGNSMVVERATSHTIQAGETLTFGVTTRGGRNPASYNYNFDIGTGTGGSFVSIANGNVGGGGNPFTVAFSGAGVDAAAGQTLVVRYGHPASWGEANMVTGSSSASGNFLTDGFNAYANNTELAAAWTQIGGGIGWGLGTDKIGLWGNGMVLEQSTGYSVKSGDTFTYSVSTHGRNPGFYQYPLTLGYGTGGSFTSIGVINPTTGPGGNVFEGVLSGPAVDAASGQMLVVRYSHVNWGEAASISLSVESVPTVPEPSTLALATLVLLPLGMTRRVRRR